MTHAGKRELSRHPYFITYTIKLSRNSNNGL